MLWSSELGLRTWTWAWQLSSSRVKIVLNVKLKVSTLLPWRPSRTEWRRRWPRQRWRLSQQSRADTSPEVSNNNKVRRWELSYAEVDRHDGTGETEGDILSQYCHRHKSRTIQGQIFRREIGQQKVLCPLFIVVYWKCPDLYQRSIFVWYKGSLIIYIGDIAINKP